jgi:hypothetical protein
VPGVYRPDISADDVWVGLKGDTLVSPAWQNIIAVRTT